MHAQLLRQLAQRGLHARWQVGLLLPMPPTRAADGEHCKARAGQNFAGKKAVLMLGARRVENEQRLARRPAALVLAPAAQHQHHVRRGMEVGGNFMGQGQLPARPRATALRHAARARA
jgi:hypothetical protein